MSKIVTIPTDGGNPFVIIHNGIKYIYSPGETVTVSDGVALEIEEWKRWREKYRNDDDDLLGDVVKTVNGVKPDKNGNVTITDDGNGVDTIARGAYVTPEMFGAKGDGVTDDTIAIKNANEHLRSLGGGTLLFPKGTYIIGAFDIDLSDRGVLGHGAIQCYSNISYIGVNGAVIKVADGVNSENFCFQTVFAGQYYGLKNVVFDGLTFDLNGQNNLMPSAFYDLAYSCAAIHTTYPFALTIKNCTFKNCPGLNCLNLGYPTGAIIKNNEFLESADAIAGNVVRDHSCILTAGWDILVDGNRFYNSVLSSVGTAIEIDGKDTRVVNNYVHNFQNGCILSPVGTTSMDNVVVTNNTFIDNKFTLVVWNADRGDNTVSNIIFANNNVRGIKSDMSGRYDVDMFTFNEKGIDNVAIHDNTFYMAQEELDHTHHGCIIIGKDARNISVENNTISDYTGNAICLSGKVSRINIKNNSITGCNRTTEETERFAIIVNPEEDVADTIVISNNTIKNVQEETDTREVVAFYLVNDCRFVTFLYNDLLDFKQDFHFDDAIFTNDEKNQILLKHITTKPIASLYLKASAGSEVLSSANMRKFIKKTNDLSLDDAWNSEWFGTGYPVSTTLYSVKGDIMFNTAPTEKSPYGWICVETGFPGTWKSLGGSAETLSNAAVDARMYKVLAEERVKYGNNVLDQFKYTELFNFASGGGKFVSTAIDERTFFFLELQTFDGSARNVIFQRAIETTGRYSASFEIGADVQTLKIAHNGTEANLSIEYDVSHLAGTMMTLSFNVESCNPSVLGGLVLKNIQLEYGSKATEFVPFGSGIVSDVKEIYEVKENAVRLDLATETKNYQLNDTLTGPEYKSGYVFIKYALVGLEFNYINIECDGPFRYMFYRDLLTNGALGGAVDVTSGTFAIPEGANLLSVSYSATATSVVKNTQASDGTITKTEFGKLADVKNDLATLIETLRSKDIID